MIGANDAPHSENEGMSKNYVMKAVGSLIEEGIAAPTITRGTLTGLTLLTGEEYVFAVSEIIRMA